MNVLEIENLVKIYYSPFLRKKSYGLRGLNLKVKEGEIFGLLGPNGAGKTTTLKSIVGILKPTSGSIKLFESYNIDRKKSLLGFLPENPYFYRHLTGYELLLFYSKIFKGKQSREKIYSLLDKVGIRNAAQKKIGNYSKGMLQRIGFAQAIINDPAFVVLDEPMSGLDPIGRKELKDLIFQLKQSGKTILFSSHILPDAEEICERVGILKDGKIVSTGNLTEVLKETVSSIDIGIRGFYDTKILSKFGNILQQGDIVYVRVDSEKKKDAVIKNAVNNGGSIVTIESRKKTLEDHFMEMIRKKR